MISNNDIIRRLRFAFDFNDATMMKLYEMAEFPVSIQDLTSWLKKEDDPNTKPIDDESLAAFLNGLIVDKRGKQNGKVPVPEKKLNNNIVLRKLKIALNLKVEEMVAIFDLADIRIGKHEISAFFRNPEQNQYRECKDQFLRNFIYGLQIKYNPET